MNTRMMLSLAALTALTLGANEKKSISIGSPSELNGTALKPGEYRLELAGDRVVMSQGKQRIEAPARIEQGEERYQTTYVLYDTSQGTKQVKEIRLGGTNRRIIFGGETSGL